MPTIKNFDSRNAEKVLELRDKAGLVFRSLTEEELSREEAVAVYTPPSEEEPDEREVR